MEISDLLKKFDTVIDNNYVIYGGSEEQVKTINNNGKVLKWYTYGERKPANDPPREYYLNILSYNEIVDATYILYSSNGISGSRLEDAIDRLMSIKKNPLYNRTIIVIGAKSIINNKYQINTINNINIINNESMYYTVVNGIINKLGDKSLQEYIPFPFKNPMEYPSKYRKDVYSYIHLYTNDGDISFTEDMPTDQIDINQQDKHINYNPNRQSTALHFGQRKLLLAEIEFLSDAIGKYIDINKVDKDWNFEDKDKFIIVYVGAAPGIHIPYLCDLFTDYVSEIHVWDEVDRFTIANSSYVKDGIIKIAPKLYQDEEYRSNIWIPSYKSEPVPNGKIMDGWFTDSVAGKYKDIHIKDNILFVSDIRDSITEDAIERDMRLQESWVKIINPYASQLKFRLPYERYDPYTYLAGTIYTQVWARPNSTESRLISYRVNNKYNSSEYLPIHYESRFAYFNTKTRTKSYNIGKVINSYYPSININSRYVDCPNDGLCTCHDCTREIQIICKYNKLYSVIPSILSITNMVSEITLKCPTKDGIGRNLWSKSNIRANPSDRYNLLLLHTLPDNIIEYSQLLSTAWDIYRKQNISNDLPIKVLKLDIASMKRSIPLIANIIIDADNLDIDSICQFLASKEIGKPKMLNIDNDRQAMITLLKHEKIPFIINFHTDLIPSYDPKKDSGEYGGTLGLKEYIQYINDVDMIHSTHPTLSEISILLLYFITSVSRIDVKPIKLAQGKKSPSSKKPLLPKPIQGKKPLRKLQ